MATLGSTKYLGTTVGTADCPECYEVCWWCSAYLWTVREGGCMTIYPRKGKCQPGEAQTGRVCGTCDGSRKVTVSRTITREVAKA